ncbi:MAG: Asp-tRNA(Asn)/Glu-tRNA(Gln) amidotransferase subunit GatC [Chloroflexota bacterium]|nr:Asp-tRNA(Asn)/Glu-tRNA(Gln) amidotransferase subunit GatC [Chloroflexota bacterium]
MSLSLEDVNHVASLARLGLTDAEKETLREQLSSILGHIEVLSQLDTDAISPTAQVIEVDNVMRDDSASPSLTQDQVTQIAPRSEKGFIAVPSVLGGPDEEGSA